MTLTRWKLMAGVLGLSIGGLAALADTTPKKITPKPTNKPCADCPTLTAPPLPVNAPNPAEVPQLTPAVNPAPLVIPSTGVDIPVPVVSTPADLVPAKPITITLPVATPAAIVQKAKTVIQKAEAAVQKAEVAPMPRLVEAVTQVFEVTVPMETAPIIPTAATAPAPMPITTPPMPAIVPSIPAPVVTAVPVKTLAPVATPAPMPISTPVKAEPVPVKAAPAPVNVVPTPVETTPTPTPTPAPVKIEPTVPTPAAIPETPAPQPVPQSTIAMEPVREKKLKVLLHMGDQRPRFEVKDGDEVYLKVVCDNVDVKAPTGKTDAQSMMRAMGRCSFVTPGGEGACDELTVVPGTGQVTVAGNVRFRYQWGRAETEVSGEKMTFRLGTTPGSLAPTEYRDLPANTVAVPASYTKPR